MEDLLITSVQTAGMVVAACIIVNIIIVRLVRYGKIKRMKRKVSHQ